MDDKDIKTEEKEPLQDGTGKEEEQRQKTYDKEGLLIGGAVGILISLFGIMSFLMAVTVGMFLGLLTGTFIKK
ncbi:MAG: hypothetical protein WC234_04505 [Endomicrobiaceae bacterium]